MTRFVFTFLKGITLAGLYFLVASGLTLIFGLMRVPRLAEGEKNGGAIEVLAPAIVEHLGNSLRALVEQGQRILLIEQNLKFE